MNGNTPYAGRPDVVEAGRRAEGADARPQLTPDQRRALRESVVRIAARTREFLPDEYTVGSELREGISGAEVRIAVRPPVGNPVSAGFQPEFDDEATDLIDAEDRNEVARGLAASAALQVKHAVGGGDVEPAAR